MFPGVATLCVCGCVYLPGVDTYLCMVYVLACMYACVTWCRQGVCTCVYVFVYLTGVGTVYVRACMYVCISLELARCMCVRVHMCVFNWSWHSVCACVYVCVYLTGVGTVYVHACI